MQIIVKTNFDLDKFNTDRLIQDWLVNSWQRIQEEAQANAPYLTWKLKQSIWVEPNSITWKTRQINIWPRKVVYAEIREYVNKLHPDRRFYMRKAFDKWESIVKEEFDKSTQKIIRLINK